VHAGKSTSRGLCIACGLILSSLKATALDLTVGSGAAGDCSVLPRVQAAAVAYLEPAPLTTINQYGGSQYVPSPGNDIGVGVAFAEISAAAPQVCVGLLYRAELEGAASRDLLDLLHANHLRQPFDVGRTYRAWYEAQSLEAEGLRLRRAFELGELQGFRFTVGIGASLLHATQGRQESLTGTVTATSATYAVGTASWLRTDSNLNPNDFNPFVGPGHPTGLGFSTDFELKVASAQGAALDVIVMDAGGRIYWHGTRNSLLMANNATIRYDEDLNRDAFVTGLDTRINEVQHIPIKYHVAVSEPVVAQLSALLEDDAVNGYNFLSVGARYGSVERNASATFDTRVHAISIGGRWRGLYASYTTNRWRPQDATALGFSLGISLRW
jgi:hypothetical protein